MIKDNCLEIKYSLYELPDNLVIVGIKDGNFIKTQRGYIKIAELNDNCKKMVGKKELELIVQSNNLIIRTCEKDSNFWFKKEHLSLFYNYINDFLEVACYGAFKKELQIQEVCDSAFICQEGLLKNKKIFFST